MKNRFEERVNKMKIKELKAEKRKWERKNLSARRRGEFFGVAIIDGVLKDIEKRLNELEGA